MVGQASGATGTPPVDRASRIEALGLSLALVPAFSILITACAFWLGIGLHGGVILLLSAAAADQAIYGRSPAEPRQRLTTAAVNLLLIGLAGLLATQVHDFSFDGQTYHQLAIMKLLDGWNPFLDPPIAGADAVWVNSYTKGAWFGEAVLASLFGSIEAGKALNLIFGISGGLILWSVLIRLLPDRPHLAKLVSGLAAANPVLASQWANFYVDSLLGSILLILIALLAGQVPGRRSRRIALISGLLLAVLASIKFSGLGFGGVFVILAAIMLFALKERALLRTYLGHALPVFLLASIVISWNPYAVNYQQHGHPFYPLQGDQPVDILTAHAAGDFLARDRLSKLIIASTATSQTGMVAGGRSAEPSLKLPFALLSQEVRLYLRDPDVRIGGFGPFFSGILLLSLVCGVVALRSFGWDGINRAGFLTAGAVLALVLAFPEPWWARYAPQFWLFPLLLILSLAARVVTGWRLWLWRGAVGAVAINVLLVWGLAMAGGLASELSYRGQLRYLRAMAHAGVGIEASYEAPPARLRLASAGIAAVEARTPRCAAPMRLINSFALICVAGRQPSDRDFTPQGEIRALLGLAP